MGKGYKQEIHKRNSTAHVLQWITECGEGNGKPLQYSCLENPTNRMKRQNDRILKEELSRSVVLNMLLEIRGEITRKNEGSQSKNNTQLWM